MRPVSTSGRCARLGNAVALSAALMALPIAAAHAQPDLRGVARRHFEQGVGLFGSQDYAAALAEFEEAYRLHPHPRILRNVAATQEALRRYLDAIASLELYVADPRTAGAERRAGQAHLAELRSLLAQIELQVEPVGAEVWVDGRLLGSARLAAPVTVASGSHQIEVRHEGYHPQSREIVVAAGAISRQQFRLDAQMSRLRLECNAVGGLVRIDGGSERQVPLQIELAPGRHVISTRARGYQPQERRIELLAGESRTYAIVLARPSASLRLHLEPRGARLFVDGEPRMDGRLSTLHVASGVHRLRVEGPGMVPWEDDISMPPGRSLALRVRLGRDRMHVRPDYFWASAIMTGALAAASAFFGVRALLLQGEYEEPWDHTNDEMRELAGDIDDAAAFTDVLLIGTALSAAASGVLYFFSRGEPPEPQVMLRD